MKRFLCTILTGTMCAGLLAGCGKKENSDTQASQAEQTSQAAQESSAGQATQGPDLSAIYSGELE